jgi:hypothetical protein
MTLVRNVVFAALLAASIPLAAQDSIRAQMTPEEFAAAGLDRLSADELARLDAWLNRTVVAESEKAAVAAKEAVQKDARGFLNFGSEEPVVARIVGEFRGFGRGREYTLDNGNVWRQIDDAQLATRPAANPQVRVTPSLVGNAWYMAVDGTNKRAKVQRVR